MILALAFIESLVIFTFVFLFLLNGKIRTLTAEQAMQIAALRTPARALRQIRSLSLYLYLYLKLSRYLAVVMV